MAVLRGLVVFGVLVHFLGLGAVVIALLVMLLGGLIGWQREERPGPKPRTKPPVYKGPPRLRVVK